MIHPLVQRPRSLPRPLERLEREFEDLFDRFGWDGWLTENRGEFVPRTDVVENDNAYEVTVELPGMKPEDFSVEMKEGSLWVSGEKQEESEEEGKTYHRIERRRGEFRRVIPLPGAVDEKHIRAQYTDGVLTVTVPKSEASKPKRIEVNS